VRVCAGRDRRHAAVVCSHGSDDAVQAGFSESVWNVFVGKRSIIRKVVKMAIIIFAALLVVGVVAMFVFRSRSQASDRRRQEENAKR
jgi:hypothetical protein